MESVADFEWNLQLQYINIILKLLRACHSLFNLFIHSIVGDGFGSLIISQTTVFETGRCRPVGQTPTFLTSQRDKLLGNIQLPNQ